MDAILKLFNQLKDIWAGWSRARKIGISVVSSLSLIACYLVVSYASRQEFVTLVSELSPADAHEIVSTLESEGIDYRLNFSGSAVSVPIPDVSRARLAIKETGRDVDEEAGGFGESLWTDPAQQRLRQQRALERRLAGSIAQLSTVRSATVHITQGEKSPFIREEIPSKASIVLQLTPGSIFSGADAQAIVSLVSHAVENLAPEDTMIVDTDGHLLSGGDDVGGDVSGQLEYRRMLERSLSSKAEAMLASLLGPGRAVVRVSADIDFTEKNTARTTYDPEQKAKIRESISSEKTTGAQNSAAAGTASNTGPLRLGGGNSDSNTETIETEYQNSEVVDTIREVPGTITRLTVAAVVELPEAAGDDSASGQTPAPVITKDQVEKIIMQAVGFDAARADEIEVMAAKMAGVPDLVVPGGWSSTLETLAPLARSASLGIAAIVALILGTMSIRRLKPVVVEVERNESLDPELRQRLADLSERMRQNPEAVSTVLANWLGKTDESDGDVDQQAQKAA